MLEKRLDKNCKMQIITRKHLQPEDFDIDVDAPTQGLRKYPFQLDQFQKAAVLSIGAFPAVANLQSKTEASWWQRTRPPAKRPWRST